MRSFAIVVFTICLLATIGTTYKFITTIAMLDRVKIVEMAAHNLLVTLLDAETGQRGYLITADAGYLIPYKLALTRIDTHMVALRAAALSDPAQTAHVADIIVLTGEKIDELARTITIRDERGLLAAATEVKQHIDKNLMDGLRLHFDAMDLLSETDFALYEANGTFYGRIAMLAMVLTLLSGSFLMFSNRR